MYTASQFRAGRRMILGNQKTEIPLNTHNLDTCYKYLVYKREQHEVLKEGRAFWVTSTFDIDSDHRQESCTSVIYYSAI